MKPHFQDSNPVTFNQVTNFRRRKNPDPQPWIIPVTEGGKPVTGVHPVTRFITILARCLKLLLGITS